MNKKGFTLIELLVVISILGILAALITNNLADARARARDSQKKSGLTQLKTALRLYYNDYQAYPTNSGTGEINGCGDIGTDQCPSPPGGIFSAGTPTATIYMRKLPASYTYESAGDDSFILSATLENASDPDITTSRNACSPSTIGVNDFYVCAD